MPKALQKRGRRMKRKHDDDLDDSTAPATAASSSKRQKSSDAPAADQDMLPLHPQNDGMSTAYPAGEKAFFGMLDEEEQDYFKRADDMLELNDFPSPEERGMFLQSVWKEADGKELKIAQSQSCSRLMERLLRISNAAQLKNVFQKFSGNFIHLLSHRFASHCCETLFECAAPCVSEEVVAAAPDASKQSDNPDGIYVSMENLFLHTLAELEGNVGFLLTDNYASHALRMLLLVLSGQPISNAQMKNLLQSKRKEGVAVPGAAHESDEAKSRDRPVPESFSKALEKLISDSVAGLDTDKLRALATHTNANPTLQLLIAIELAHYGKGHGKNEKSILRTLLPDDPITAESESAAFMGGMVYDPIGSHLVEKIIECAPAKVFKSLYNGFFKERLATYARNECGTYVNCRILERLGYDDLLDAHEILCPVIPNLLEKQWTSMARVLIERCNARQVDTQAIAAKIGDFFVAPDGSFDLSKLLKIDVKPETPDGGIVHTEEKDKENIPADRTGSTFNTRPAEPAKVHFNILAQGMLIVPGALSGLILDSMVELDADTLVNIAADHIITRTLQQALTTHNSTIIGRRKLIQRFYGKIGEMALDKFASHVVDCIWEGTHGLAFIRERIAEELAENEAALRESPSGRAVWKNWKMDLYKRRRGEWVRQSKNKASNDGFQDFSELDKKKPGDGRRKTPLELARERHMANKEKKEKKKERSETRGRTMSRGNAGPARAPAAAASG